MPASAHDAFVNLLYERLMTMPGLSVAMVDFQDVPFATPRDKLAKGADQPGKYVSVAYQPNTSDLAGIAYDSEVTDTGLLALNATCPAGQGVLPAIQFAQQLVNVFLPGLVLYDPTTKAEVRIIEQPRVASPLEGTDNLTIPVIVRWVATTPKSGS
jgi:hypothetical protein